MAEPRFGRTTVRLPPLIRLLPSLLVALAPSTGRAAAQATEPEPPPPAEGSAPARYSTAFLPLDHWGTAAAGRLAALGLAPGFDPAMRPHTQREIGEMLERAIAADVPLPSGVADLVRAWDARYRAELSLADDLAIGGTPSQWRTAAARWLAGSGVEAGYVRSTGSLSSGWGDVAGDPNVAVWHPPTPRPDLSGQALAASFQITPHPALALRASVIQEDSDGSLEEGYLTGRAGIVALWAGRRHAAFGPGSQGVVLSPTPVDGFGIQTVRSFRLPWLLRHAGAIQLALTLGQRDLPRSYDDVTMLTTRGSIEPHPRLRLGLSRGAFFGGQGNGDVDLFDVFSVLIGKHAGEIASELDNQVVAVDVDFRPPTERWLPLRMYVEWGFEDSAGAWRSVPGVMAGVESPAVPGVPGLSLAVERASFGRSCCGNPPWYRHRTFQDGWTYEGRPMGHGLGGHGNEWALVGGLALLDARLRVDLRAFSRWRGDENLFAPDREGDSAGAEAGLEVDLGSGLRARTSAAVEDGAGWRETAFRVGLHAFL